MLWFSAEKQSSHFIEFFNSIGTLRTFINTELHLIIKLNSHSMEAARGVGDKWLSFPFVADPLNYYPGPCTLAQVDRLPERRAAVRRPGLFQQRTGLQ